MSQSWPPGPRSAPLTLVRGVPHPDYLGPSATLFAGMVTVVGRIGDGNGLTLSSSFQVLATLPDWAIPTKRVQVPATNSATGGATVRVLETGELDGAVASANAITFAFSYPLA